VIRHNGCRGFKIWKWGKIQIELWLVPKHEYIEPHVHQTVESMIMLIFGTMVGRIDETAGTVKPFHRYSVPAGVIHSARAQSFCAFINIERWHGEPTSAADDFTAV